jgi:uncharacterized protein YwgA
MDVKLVFQYLQWNILANDKLQKQVFIDKIMKFPFVRDAGLSTLNYYQLPSKNLSPRSKCDWATDWKFRGSITLWESDFSLFQILQSGFVAHPDSLLMGSDVLFRV